MPRTCYLDITDYSPGLIMDRPWGGRPARAVRMKRGDSQGLALYFVEDGVTVDPPAGASFGLQAKRQGAARGYSGLPVLVGVFEQLVDAAGRKYLLITPNWDDVAVLASLLTPAYGSEPGAVMLSAEISWEAGDDVWSTEVFDLAVLNDVVKNLTDTPSAPSEGAAPTAETVVHNMVIDATLAEVTVTVAAGYTDLAAHSTNGFGLSWSDSNNLDTFAAGEQLVRRFKGVVGGLALVYPVTTVVFPLGATGTVSVEGFSGYPEPTLS